MSRARQRPPRLEPASTATPATPAPDPSLEMLVERAKVAGPVTSGPGRNELRRIVERLVASDRSALGALAPMPGLTAVEVWSAVGGVFGATAGAVAIDPARTIAGAREAQARVRSVARAGGRIALATGRPASLLMLHLAFVRAAHSAGGEVCEFADVGPIRADGRTGRWLRWVGGIAVVSDGDALCATRDAEVAREWIFTIPRPSLVVADGPFAEVATERGVEVVALAGLDRPAIAVAAARGGRCTVVPMHTDRPARAYRSIEALIAADDADTRPVAAASDPEV